MYEYACQKPFICSAVFGFVFLGECILREFIGECPFY